MKNWWDGNSEGQAVIVIIKFCLFCVSEDIDDYEVEDFLADIMNTEFDTIVEDGSLSQVSMSDIFRKKILLSNMNKTI